MTSGPRTARRCAAAVALCLAAAATAPLPHPAGPSAGHLTLLGDKWGGKASDTEALAGTRSNNPDKDPGSLYTITKAIGARKLWKHTAPDGSALSGAGVTVAVLDSGISPVAGLDAPGKVVVGPDLSGSSADPSVDEVGHGTFIAGLIGAADAPRRPDGKPARLDEAAPGVQQGLAPGAQLLSLKLTDRSGEADVEAAIGALSWLVQHRHDNGMDVRVANLSFGAQALQPYQRDPLAAAVEAAWRAGIVVVAAGGNAGPDSGGLDDPAMDPYVLAVGATDPRAKVSGWDHPVVAGFSSAGTAQRTVDVLAPGASTVSLRVLGSALDVDHPSGRVAGDGSQRLFRGSGTSQATAVVSGAVAVLLQAHPELTPDQVKGLLVGTADGVKDASPLVAGAGQVDLEAALTAADRLADGKDKGDLPTGPQAFPRSEGLDGVDLGTQDGIWSGAKWSGAKWSGAKWSGAKWSGAKWSGAKWSGSWTDGDTAEQ